MGTVPAGIGSGHTFWFETGIKRVPSFNRRVICADTPQPDGTCNEDRLARILQIQLQHAALLAMSMSAIESHTIDLQQSGCFQCGSTPPPDTMIGMRVPSETMAHGARRGTVVRVKMCRTCALQTGGDDAYLSMFLKHEIARLPEMLSRTSDPDQDGQTCVFTHEEQLLAHAHYDGMPKFISNPAYERILAVIVKNARAHALAELGCTLQGWPDTMIVKMLPTTSMEWVTSFLEVDHTRTWPKAGSRLMVRMFTGENLQSGWIVVAPGSYVYTVFENDGVTVRSIIGEYVMSEITWRSGTGTSGRPA